MTDQTYNGWTNYATRWIHLELFDGIDGKGFTADMCRDLVDELIAQDVHNTSNLAARCADAFLLDVNWQEIADHLNEED